MKPETPDCSFTSTAYARMPLGILATNPGGVPLGPNLFSTSGSPSIRLVATQRSSTSFEAENAPTGTADLLRRSILTISGLITSSSLKSRAATTISTDSSSATAGRLKIRRVTNIAPRPSTTAITSITNDLLFMDPLAFRLSGASNRSWPSHCPFWIRRTDRATRSSRSNQSRSEFRRGVESCASSDAPRSQKVGWDPGSSGSRGRWSGTCPSALPFRQRQ